MDTSNRMEAFTETSSEMPEIIKGYGSPMLMTLCPFCVHSFYSLKDHIVRRANVYQEDKDYCNYCHVRKGFDYYIYERKR